MLSAIRIVDVFWVPRVPTEGSGENPPVIKINGCALIKGVAGTAFREHSIQFKVQNEKSEDPYILLGDAVRLPVREVTPGLEMVPLGGSVNLEIHVAVKAYGTSYLCLFIDGEEAIRTPFTILPPQESEKQAG